MFNSLTFVAFLGIVTGAYWVCPAAWRRWCLLGASYAFYCTWSLPFAGLLLGVTAVAFVVARQIGAAEQEEVQRQYLAIGVVLLLLPLAAFKYSNTVSGLLTALLGHTAATSHLAGLQVVGAIGISYYSLKLISYVVDVYWGRLRPCRDFTTLATYAAFFPQILSGPIQRAESFIGQFERLGRAQPDLVASGLRLMLFGFFKKLVVADRLGVLVDQVFTQPRAFSGTTLAVGSYLFAIQLYADFSGITDIAIGTARLFGIQSPRNFDSPFYAENIQDFWRRWHITLTTWLGDYVFTPLRMALRDWGQWGLILSLSINMLAIGIWHGPRWTFVVFGALQAFYLIVSSLTLRPRKRFLQHHAALQGLHEVFGPLVTFHMVVASFVWFRAESLADAWYILGHAGRGLAGAALRLAHVGARAGLAGTHHLKVSDGDAVILVGATLLMEVLHLLQRRQTLSRVVVTMPDWARWAGYLALGFAILVWGEADSKQFIYVRF